MDLLSPTTPTPLQEVTNSDLEAAGVRLFIKRDDLIHPTVSGNKWRKLKYSLLDAKQRGSDTLLTFGGAYSNHLYATAAAGDALGFKTIGILRGLEWASQTNATLEFCRDCGMKLHYVTREEYRQRNSPDYLDMIARQFGNPYLIPEGGTTRLALQGVAEIVDEVRGQLGYTPDYFATAAGTGGTAAGLLSTGSNVLAFSALKGGGFLRDDVLRLSVDSPQDGKLALFTDYHFGGYAKWNAQLLTFMENFKEQSGIQLEQVYTAKMLFGLFDLVKNNYFCSGTTVVALHTGGLQGLLRA